MRAAIFVTLTFAFFAHAQVGLNGKIATQSGFTRTQLEREVQDQTVSNSNNSHITIYGGSPDSACLTTACRMAGTFGCDDENEILDLSNACRGNPGDSCLKQICQTLGEFGCDEFREVRQILISCGGNSKSVGLRAPDSSDRQTQSDF